MSVLAAVRRTIRRHAMLAGGERVLVGVSGGPDSVALLLVLTQLAPEWRLRLHVLHVDHRLRPDSAADADLVREVGRRLGVPVDVTAVTVDARGSLEAAARAARYAALEACADRIGADRVALGHTADDQAETVLMRLLGGAGLRGLAGIPPVRGRIIRPLLDVRRAAILDELAAAGLPWTEDPSNRDPKFLRNRIRHELLPQLAATWSGAIVTTLVTAARRAREAVDALDAVALRELDRLGARGPGSIVLPRAELARLPRPVAVAVLVHAARSLGAVGPLRAWAHRGLRRVLDPSAPRRPLAIGGVTIEVGMAALRVATAPPVALPTRELPVPGRVALPEIGAELTATIRDHDAAVPRGADRVAFDADRLAGPLVVRARRRGDRFRPFGSGERRLKAVLIDARVERWERARVPVVEAGGEIVWLAGLRRGAAAPVTAATRRVLELSLLALAQ